MEVLRSSLEAREADAFRAAATLASSVSAFDAAKAEWFVTERGLRDQVVSLESRVLAADKVVQAFYLSRGLGAILAVHL